VRICVIASSRFPVAEPFAGGLEAWTHGLVRELAGRGHDVTLFAGPGSDPTLPATLLPVDAFAPSEAALADVNSPPVEWMRDHHAYLGLVLELRDQAFDVVHNTSLHHLPVAMAAQLSAPLLTTLHTPPVPWLESAIRLTPDPGAFVAVSRRTAAAWAHAVRTEVILNGVDVSSFVPGPGGGPAVWSGRLVREKAPHQAIDAARLAGVELVLAGPISDPAYVDAEVRPRLGDGVEYAGHLDRRELAALLGRASVAVVTPDWDEPYGLVAAEAMACGTPVAGYARGALPELVDTTVGELAPAGDVAGLATSIQLAQTCDRATVRRHAERHCSQLRMVDEYERLYTWLHARSAA
jgi:glycosyltransferase involved in cell wall biosynthesis